MRVMLSFVVILVVITISSQVNFALPNNIRILVNNENLQSPPYLLEAFKQQQQNTTRTTGQLNVDNKQEGLQIRNVTTEKSEPLISEESTIQDNKQPSTANSFSLVKEETIEEILEPDTLDTSPPLDDSLISNNNPMIPEATNEHNSNSNDYANSDNGSININSGQPPLAVNSNLQPFPGSNNGLAQPQIHKKQTQALLPVANSHLKKPANNLKDQEELTSIPAGSQGHVNIEKNKPKSLVSATVVEAEDSEETDKSKELLKGKLVQIGNQPDVIQPNQVMAGITNVSLVPATINKDYGRTRITLGGGYQRDRLAPLENPSSSNYNDDKPEKPLTPLETASQIKREHKPTMSEDSQILPERIILPDVKEFSSSFNNRSFVKDLKRCPKSGIITFEHPNACDRYFYCREGYISEQQCPNGLMYGTRDTIRDYCIHRWLAQCEDKSVPNPISSPGCRWQFGIFNVQGSPKCTPDYYECEDGVFQVKKCSIEGQVYDDRTKSCQFAELIGCAKEALADFQCPPDDQANTYWPFPRYFLNERALIHCINDKPEIVRCTSEERVDPEHLHCVPISKQQLAAQSSLDSRNVRERKTTAKPKEQASNES